MHEEYYITCLYPFQSGIINIIKRLNTPFYLTGGTALSRCYYEHRYSEDLDYFINQNEQYNSYIKKIINALKEGADKSGYSIDKKHIIAEENYTQVILTREIKGTRVNLKLEFVHDIVKRFGKIIEHHLYGKIDNVMNILSNKVTALYRLEPKDIADIWIIAKNESFSWEEIIGQAKEKEAGINPLQVSEIIREFPLEYIHSIKWKKKIDEKKFIAELNTIARNILFNNKNSLHK